MKRGGPFLRTRLPFRDRTAAGSIGAVSVSLASDAGAIDSHNKNGNKTSSRNFMATNASTAFRVAMLSAPELHQAMTNSFFQYSVFNCKKRLVSLSKMNACITKVLPEAVF